MARILIAAASSARISTLPTDGDGPLGEAGIALGVDLLAVDAQGHDDRARLVEKLVRRREELAEVARLLSFEGEGGSVHGYRHSSILP